MDQQLYSQAVWFIQRLDKRYAINKGVGWVYALRNSEFKRPLLKIGMTTTSPHQRAHELGSATGVPGNFEIVYFIHAVNCGQAEFYVHQRLADYRTTGEFFDVPIGAAVDAMDEVANRDLRRVNSTFAGSAPCSTSCAAEEERFPNRRTVMATDGLAGGTQIATLEPSSRRI